MSTYSGKFTTEKWYETFKDGETFDPAPSQRVHNHSPDGYSWGYTGSGCAQLALGILLDVLPKECQHLAENNYMDFKDKVIANLPKEEGSTWELTTLQVLRWLGDHQQQKLLKASKLYQERQSQGKKV